MSQELAPLQPEIVVRKPALHALKPIQRRAILALLETPTIQAAAEAIGRDQRTLFRWLRNPIFRACLEAACASRDLSFELQAAHSAGLALDVLADLAADKYKETPFRVQAARHILEYADRRSARRSRG